jgi:hypothetical protein
MHTGTGEWEKIGLFLIVNFLGRARTKQTTGDTRHGTRRSKILPYLQKFSFGAAKGRTEFSHHNSSGGLTQMSARSASLGLKLKIGGATTSGLSRGELSAEAFFRANPRVRPDQHVKSLESAVSRWGEPEKAKLQRVGFRADSKWRPRKVCCMLGR